MSIQVKFFASLRESMGVTELSLDKAATTAEVWQLATGNKPMPDNVLVAVNLEYAKFDTTINDGDEVAFFPPVTGG